MLSIYNTMERGEHTYRHFPNDDINNTSHDNHKIENVPGIHEVILKAKEITESPHALDNISCTFPYLFRDTRNYTSLTKTFSVRFPFQKMRFLWFLQTFPNENVCGNGFG